MDIFNLVFFSWSTTKRTCDRTVVKLAIYKQRSKGFCSFESEKHPYALQCYKLRKLSTDYQDIPQNLTLRPSFIPKSMNFITGTVTILNSHSIGFRY